MQLTRDPARPALVQAGGVLLLAVTTAAVWWGWFAWDSEYQIDPVTQGASGPYETWQGVGAALCAVVVCVVALRWLRPLVVGVVMPPAFTLAFAFTAVPSDETGLAVIGVLLMAVGTSVGAVLLIGIIEAVRHVWDQHHPA